jgi:hypothetical protein
VSFAARALSDAAKVTFEYEVLALGQAAADAVTAAVSGADAAAFATGLTAELKAVPGLENVTVATTEVDSPAEVQPGPTPTALPTPVPSRLPTEAPPAIVAVAKDVQNFVAAPLTTIRSDETSPWFFATLGFFTLICCVACGGSLRHVLRKGEEKEDLERDEEVARRMEEFEQEQSQREQSQSHRKDRQLHFAVSEAEVDVDLEEEEAGDPPMSPSSAAPSGDHASGAGVLDSETPAEPVTELELPAVEPEVSAGGPSAPVGPFGSPRAPQPVAENSAKSAGCAATCCEAAPELEVSREERPAELPVQFRRVEHF